jgi:hypothetical protein
VLEEYHYEIQYPAGKLNCTADSLTVGGRQAIQGIKLYTSWPGLDRDVTTLNPVKYVK